jgi:probable F420-dependent oxidoreductase
VDVASEIEALGYGAIWSTGGFKPGLPSRFERLLDATSRIVVASGIVNVWLTDASDLATQVSDLDRKHHGRFLLGLGASHGALVKQYSRPYRRMVEYLDALDGARPSVPKERRALAALGPRMLSLAAERAAGAHPYFVPVEHTVRARTALGEGTLLAPEVTAVLEEDPVRAREIARTFTAGYLTLPNYSNNLRTLGFDDHDLSGGGSDRLVDAVVAWGGATKIASRVREHHEAGADHVCIQIVSGAEGFPLAQYRELAGALLPG